MQPHESLVKKSVTLNKSKLNRVKKLLKTRNDSETIRALVDKELGLQQAVRANRRLTKLGKITPIIWR